MEIVRLEALTLDRGTTRVLERVDWKLERGARVGVVGPNGSGKTSLLRLLAREIEPDRGRTVWPRTTSVGLLHQEPSWPAGTTLIEAASAPSPELAAVEAELARIESRLADPRVYGEAKRLERELARQETALDAWRAMGGDRHADRVHEGLDRFALHPHQHDTDVERLSGGQKKIVSLVSLAAAGPDLLLLDEPDNHLDLEAKRRLESFIADYPGTVVIVSHDRYLLDSVALEIVELEGARLRSYAGNYTSYTAARELHELEERRQHAVQQKEVARIEAQIARFEHWAHIVENERHIKQARSRRRALDRMRASDDWVERPTEARPMELAIAGGRGSEKAVALEHVCLSLGARALFRDLSLTVRHGERVGIVGPNGCGKSTLFRILLGERAPDRGRVALGPSTRPGYYAQEHDALAERHGQSPVDWLRSVAPLREDEAVHLLLRLRFAYEHLRNPIGTLSGGERSRLQLGAIMLRDPNLLLLDEPTNHLDIASAEVLESVLDAFEGAIVTISHDRYFLDACVDRIEAFEDRRLVTYPGGYTDYLERGERP